MEPLYPQVCQKTPPFKPPSTKQPSTLTPTHLSRLLNSIPCSLSFKRDEPLSIFHLIMEARHYMTLLWSAVQFLLGCCVCLAFTQLLAAFFLLPPLYTPGQVLWLVCFIVPMLGVTLLGTPTDSDVMKKPLGKNQIVFNVEVRKNLLYKPLFCEKNNNCRF